MKLDRWSQVLTEAALQNGRSAIDRIYEFHFMSSVNLSQDRRSKKVALSVQPFFKSAKK